LLDNVLAEAFRLERALAGARRPQRGTLRRPAMTRVRECLRWIAVFVSALVSRGALADEKKADLVLLGGKVVTVDPKRPVAEALAARGDRIVAVGSDQEIAGLIGDGTRVLRLQGRLAIPGFVEGHGHFTGLGQSKMMLDLRKARSWDEIV